MLALAKIIYDSKGFDFHRSVRFQRFKMCMNGAHVENVLLKAVACLMHIFAWKIPEIDSIPPVAFIIKPLLYMLDF